MTNRHRIFLVAIALVSLSTTAQAQVYFHPESGEPYKYNVGFNTALRASDTNASVFGAASIAERVIFPALHQDGDYVLRFSGNTLFGGVSVPVDCLAFESECGGSRNGMSPVDFTAASVAMGYRLGDLGLFYATSTTGTILAPGPFGRAFNGTLGAFYSGVGSVGGPLADNLLKHDARYEDININGFNYQTDYILGAQYDLGFMQARAGYVGSKGYFTNLSQADLRLFLTSVLTSELKTLPYLRTGVEKFPWKELGVDDMLTSVYARKIRMVAPYEPDPTRSDSALKELSSYNFWTAHLQQLSVAKYFDFLAAFHVNRGFRPNELRVGYHSEGFHQATPGSKKDDSRKAEEGFGVNAGIVNVPDMYYYGKEGGTKIAFALEARCRWASVRISRNDPELLAIFPFAYDSWNLSWEFGTDTLMGRKDRD